MQDSTLNIQYIISTEVKDLMLHPPLRNINDLPNFTFCFASDTESISNQNTEICNQL